MRRESLAVQADSVVLARVHVGRIYPRCCSHSLVPAIPSLNSLRKYAFGCGSANSVFAFMQSQV